MVRPRASCQQTGAWFVARSGQNAVVQFVANDEVSATNNANHGIVGAAEGGTLGFVSLAAGTVPSVDNNGEFGLVAVAVGTNAAVANAINASGVGNGSGNVFEHTALTGAWEDLLP